MNNKLSISNYRIPKKSKQSNESKSTINQYQSPLLKVDNSATTCQEQKGAKRKSLEDDKRAISKDKKVKHDDNKVTSNSFNGTNSSTKKHYERSRNRRNSLPGNVTNSSKKYFEHRKDRVNTSYENVSNSSKKHFEHCNERVSSNYENVTNSSKTYFEHCNDRVNSSYENVTNSSKTHFEHCNDRVNSCDDNVTHSSKKYVEHQKDKMNYDRKRRESSSNFNDWKQSHESKTNTLHGTNRTNSSIIKQSSYAKNIAADRLEKFRKSLPSILSPALESTQRNTSVVNENKEVLSNVPLISPTSGLTKSFANKRLEIVRESLVKEAIFREKKIVSTPSTSSTNNEEEENVEMDWEPIPEEKIIQNIVDVRNTFINNPNILNDLQTTFNIASNKSSTELNQVKKSNLFIIVDTNVFLSKLNIIKELLDFDYNNRINPTIIIPWMVLQELDFFKTNENNEINRHAKIATKYINEQLSNKNPRLIGQSAIEASDSKIRCQGPDDRILDCCLNLQTKDNIVIILTNDINLRNKAMVNNVEAFGTNEIIMKIKERFKPYSLNNHTDIDETKINEKFGHLHTILSNLFKQIVQKEMQNAYGDVWMRMVNFKQSWTMPVILKCMIKYWRSVYHIIYPKHVLPCLEKLLEVFENCRFCEDDLKKIINAAIAVCLHLQSVSEEYFDLIVPCIKELKAL